ncbi:MAG: HEAT repeat domain-containing protein, partial [Myxococcota bacterium]
AAGDDPLLSQCSLKFSDTSSSLVDVALDRTLSRSARLRALQNLGTDGSHDIAVAGINKLIVDDDPAMRAAAVEWSIRRPDVADADALAVCRGDVALQKAALLGASCGGRAVFRSLAELASTADVDVRGRALRLLALRFKAHAKPVVQAALLDKDEAVGRSAVLAASAMGPTGIGLLRHAIGKASLPGVTVAALEALLAREDASFDEPSVRRALVDVAPQVQQAGLRHMAQVADGMLPELLNRVAASNRADLAHAVVDGLVQAGPGGFEGLVAVVKHEGFASPVRRRALELLRSGHSTDLPSDLDALEAWELAETVPVSPASPPWSDSSERRPASDPEAVVLPGSSRPKLQSRRDRGPRPLSLARAQQALAVALQNGQGGYRALRTLAESARVPDEVRVQALRHIGADFPDRDVRLVLEAALDSARPEVQTAALGALMVRSDARLMPVARLARDPDVPIGLRMRAARFLGTRWTNREARSDLEALLDSEHEGLRRVALEGLFPSMCYTPPEKVEARLINLLQSHGVAAVRASAARALGAFGGKAGLAALSAIDAWRLPSGLKSAIAASKRRLSDTVGDAAQSS